MTLDEAKNTVSALQEALSTGVQTVDVNGRRVTYHSPSDMSDAIDKLLRDIRKAEGKQTIRVATWTGAK